MSDILWIVAAAGIGAAVGAWWYAGREERVRGRGVAAALRALAVALLLAGLRLPPLPARPGSERDSVVLLDVSRSMSLPAAPGGPARADSARSLLAGLRVERVILFGEEPRAVPAESALAARPEAGASRLAPALVAAAAGGARRVLVLGDGEWDDRLDAVAEAERLGLAVEERRMSAPAARVGLLALAAPARGVAGDTLEARVELVAGGEAAALPDSVEILLSTGGREVARVRVAVPSPGRRARAPLRFVPDPPSGEAEWRSYEASLAAGADPYAAAERSRAWIEVSRGARGAVLVSLASDWEARFLLPVLEGAAAGGARAYLRVAPDRFVRVGSRPASVGAGVVEREARLADLLVVQAEPGSVPAWLAGILARRGRVLHLPRGRGPLPGTPLRVDGMLAGDWYPSAEPSPSPVSGFLAGVELEALPPPGGLLALGGGEGWTPLSLRRDRQGPPRPLLLAGGDGDERWAALAGTGTWRWALRDGPPRQAYRALFAGVVGWLLEAPPGRPVELESDALEAGRPLRWRIAPRVRDLALAVYDSAGVPVWGDTLADPPDRLVGPAAPRGSARFVAAGRGPDGEFRVERPFEAGDAGAELLPRQTAEPLRLEGREGGAGRGPSPRRRAVWPFVVAVLALCAEWTWRRRIGLR